MYKIKKDVEKNRLYIHLSGLFSVAEAKSARDIIYNEIENLQPGFDVINDISQFIRGQEEGALILQEIMRNLIEKKVNRIVRVIGNSKVGLMQFANYSIPIDSYKLRYVPTLEEAEKFLDQKEEK